jgi:hypothetical protein
MASSDFGLLKEMFTQYRIYIGSEFGYIFIPPLPKGGGGYTVLPLSVCPSKIFGHKQHIGIPYCG